MEIPPAVFADASYWIALLHPKDQNNQSAREIDKKLKGYRTRISTSDLILTEVLAFFASSSRSNIYLKDVAGRAVEILRGRSELNIIPFIETPFSEAFNDYRRYRDKKWSLVDCSSFIAMRKNGLDTALSYDGDFHEAGFTTIPLRHSKT